MKIDELIHFFDAKAIAEGKITFTFHVSKTGNWNFWNFWCDKSTANNRNELAEQIMTVEELAKQEITRFKEVSLEPWDEHGLKVRVTF